MGYSRRQRKIGYSWKAWPGGLAKTKGRLLSGAPDQQVTSLQSVATAVTSLQSVATAVTSLSRSTAPTEEGVVGSSRWTLPQLQSVDFSTVTVGGLFRSCESNAYYIGTLLDTLGASSDYPDRAAAEALPKTTEIRRRWVVGTLAVRYAVDHAWPWCNLGSWLRSCRSPDIN